MTDPAARSFVLASGPPGPGKTSLAAPLAAEFGVAWSHGLARCDDD